MNIELTDRECIFILRLLSEEYETLSKVTRRNDKDRPCPPVVTHILATYIDVERDLFYKLQKAYGEMLDERISNSFEEELFGEELKKGKKDEKQENYPHRKRKQT